MFYKEIFEQTGPGGAFLEHLEAETLKIYLVKANHNGFLKVRCMYRSTKEDPGYATDSLLNLGFLIPFK